MSVNSGTLLVFCLNRDTSGTRHKNPGRLATMRFMSVEEGGVEVRESAVPGLGPSESRDESNQKSIVGDVYCYMTDIPWCEA